MVIMDSSVPGRVSRCRPAWRKCMISTIRLVSTIVFIGLSETNTIGSKDLTWLEKHLWLSLAYYHFVLPHDSLSQRLSAPQPTRGSGSPQKWQPITPAMAAGLTDHVWTMEELLSYRVPPDFRDRLDQ